MITLFNLVSHILEGIAITFAIYLVGKQQLGLREFATISLSITVTLLVLDLFSPGVAMGTRQGAGFGLGFNQIAGATPMPRSYYNENGKLMEGMDDPTALDYYSKLNPQSSFIGKQTPSVILGAYDNSSFKFVK